MAYNQPLISRPKWNKIKSSNPCGKILSAIKVVEGPFGMIVDLGKNRNALIKKYEINWSEDNVEFEFNMPFDVEVIDYDNRNRRLIVSIKELYLKSLIKRYEIGQTVEGFVVRFDHNNRTKHNITNVSNYKQAVNSAKKNIYDFLLLDLFLGENEPDGIEAAMEIIKLLPDIKIIIITGALSKNNISDIQKIKNNVIEIFFKPVDYLSLIKIFPWRIIL